MSDVYFGRDPGEAAPMSPEPREARGEEPPARQEGGDPRIAAVRMRLQEGGYDDPRVLAEVARRIVDSGALHFPQDGGANETAGGR